MGRVWKSKCPERTSLWAAARLHQEGRAEGTKAPLLVHLSSLRCRTHAHKEPPACLLASIQAGRTTETFKLETWGLAQDASSRNTPRPASEELTWTSPEPAPGS